MFTVALVLVGGWILAATLGSWAYFIGESNSSPDPQL
jgi:hypothetical protein